MKLKIKEEKLLRRLSPTFTPALSESNLYPSIKWIQADHAIGLKACNFIKKGTSIQVFSCEICGIFEKIIFTEHLWWLLLYTTLLNIYEEAFLQKQLLRKAIRVSSQNTPSQRSDKTLNTSLCMTVCLVQL